MAADGEEDFVGGRQAGEGSRCAADFRENCHGVGELAGGEVREVDVDDLVACGLELGESFFANF